MERPAPEVRHNKAMQRFESTTDGHLNVADYVLSDNMLVMTHTAVHPSLRGRGVAAALVEHALAYARAEGLKVIQGQVLRENATMLKMCRELGFKTINLAETPESVGVELAL